MPKYLIKNQVNVPIHAAELPYILEAFTLAAKSYSLVSTVENTPVSKRKCLNRTVALARISDKFNAYFEVKEIKNGKRNNRSKKK